MDDLLEDHVEGPITKVVEIKDDGDPHREQRMGHRRRATGYGGAQENPAGHVMDPGGMDDMWEAADRLRENETPRYSRRRRARDLSDIEPPLPNWAGDDTDKSGRPLPVNQIPPAPPPVSKAGARRKTAWSGWGPAVFPKARKVAGWDWDEHLSGYVADRPHRFVCSCDRPFNTPGGFHRCACGKNWNSYVIGSGGSSREASPPKFLVREIPVRDNVIVARRKRSAPSYSPISPKDETGEAFGEAPQSVPLGLNSFTPNGARVPGGTSDGGAEWRFKEKAARVVLVDPRTGRRHVLIKEGPLDDGEEERLPRMKKTPADWHHRDRNQRWRPNPIGH